MNTDFEKSKSALWKKYEKRIGGRIPDDFRKSCEEDVGLYSDDDVALEDLNGYLDDYFNKLQCLEIVNYFSSRKERKVAATKHYQRCFEKRLYLVSFVMNCLMTKTRRKYRAVMDNYMERLHKHINWKQICLEWNDIHPNDFMSQANLKVRFYRAIAEENIQREYLNRKFPTIMKEIWERAGVQPYSTKLTFGERERKHNFVSDISFLTMLEELKSWQDETAWMFSDHQRELHSRRAQNERLNNSKG